MSNSTDSSTTSQTSMLTRKAIQSTPWKLYFKQLRALLWKSLITRRVHYVSTFFEAIGPLLLPIFICLLYSKVDLSYMSGPDQPANKSSAPTFVGPILNKNPVFSIKFDDTDFKNVAGFKVYFAPNNPFTQKLMSSLARSNVQLFGVDTEEIIIDTLVKEAEKISESQLAFFPALGVSFTNTSISNGQISYHLLTLGTTEFNHATAMKYPIKFDQAPAGVDPFSYYRFVQISSYINRDFFAECCRISSSPDCAQILSHIEVCKMPYPRYQNSEQGKQVQVLDWVGLVTTLGYILVCPLIVKRITDEKDCKMKEMLRMIGMSDSVFWSSHFINFFVIVVIQAFAFVYIFFGFENPVIHRSSVSLFTTFFLLYGIQLILFSMLITTIFNRPVLAVIVTTILWFVSSIVIFRILVPSVATDQLNIENKNSVRFMTSMTPMGSLLWFLSILGDLENSKQSGLYWSNINTSHTIYTNFTALSVVFAIVLSYFIYCFLIFYLDNVWSFQHGVPKSPFFLFRPSYWYPNEAKISDSMPPLDSNNYESEPNLEPNIQIQDLCKAFHTKAAGKKLAVDHLWLNIYQNQLTVLLGHNGAGKTTTMNMITGMFPSTSGSVFVNRYNVFTQTNQARRSIGLCPQENIYFHELTVAQHLKLFALLKDFDSSKVNKEVNYVLELLALMDKKNVLAEKLSGGMKRKLALGIALIGDTETLILDEPTSGMDPEARRLIWDLLISMRRQRTILLTTHYMEEADVLADRIAIMNDGKLRCSGSPLFLKNAFGTGYRLRVAKLKDFHSSNFVSILQRYVPSATLISEVETEVVYGLEAEKSELMNAFPALFDDIEKNKRKYCIDSCGLSYSTLEDVFLSVGADVDLSPKRRNYDSTDSNVDGNLLLSKQTELITGSSLFATQLYGLMCKRLHFARRYWPMIVLQLLLPAAIIALAMYIDNKIRTANELNTLKLNVKEIYGRDTQAFFYGDQKYFSDYEAVNSKLYHAKTSSISHSIVKDPVSEWVLKQANTSGLDEYLHSFIYGLERHGNVARTWFNNEQYHSLPLSIIAMFEGLLRSILPEHMRDLAKIDVTSIPLSSGKGEHEVSLFLIILSWIITCLLFIPIAFPFLAASYILYPIKEQASKSKLIQLMTGLSPVVFWIANFLFDLLNHLLATGVLFLIIYSFDSGNGMFGKGDQNSGFALFLMILAFGVSTIPVVYACSYFSTLPSGGFIFITIVYLIFGIIANIVFSTFHILNNFLNLDLLTNWINPLLYIVRIVPIFSLLYGYQKVYLLSAMNEMCRNMKGIDKFCQVLTPEGMGKNSMLIGCCPDKCGSHCYTQENAFRFSNLGAGVELLYLFVSGLFFFVLMLLFESHKLQILKILSILPSRLRKSFPTTKGNTKKETLLLSIDSDVEKERVRMEQEVANPSSMTDLLAVFKLRKTFGNFTAVDDISFGVRYDECFGFLGVNGAGKTTTFSMLTGDIAPTAGNAYIARGKYTLLNDLGAFQRNIGYCPQFNALLDKLTGEETLYLFARLRGVPQRNQKRDIQNLIQMVGLEEHFAKLTETYSGGNQRKLSIAIALIGSPCLIFLDEPSAGVDPAARRKIWETLGYIKRNLKSSIVLTSHSMEECEALCSRVAIMVNGTLRCLGSTQHLRTKYGQGYSVSIRLKRERESDSDYIQSLQDEMNKHIPSALLKDYHQCLMHYHITDTRTTWTQIFTQMNRLNERFDFEDYFVSDTTLEQIFILFARHQQVQNDPA